LPDVKFLPAKVMASSIPDNVDRPPVEKLVTMVTGLFNEEKGMAQNRLARE